MPVQIQAANSAKREKLHYFESQDPERWQTTVMVNLQASVSKSLNRISDERDSKG